MKALDFMRGKDWSSARAWVKRWWPRQAEVDYGDHVDQRLGRRREQAKGIVLGGEHLDPLDLLVQHYRLTK